MMAPPHRVPTPHRVALAALTAAWANSATAQTTWTVTSATGIPAAIQAASPGDVIQLVASVAPYEPFALDKGITLRGDGARIGYWPGFSTFSISVAVPPGQVAHIEDIDLTSAYSPYGGGSCQVNVSSGTVRFEQTAFGTGNGPALQVLAGDVVFLDCTATAWVDVLPDAPIVVNGGSLTMSGCSVTATHDACHPVGCFVGQVGASPALSANGGSVHAQFCTFTGGDHTGVGGAVGDGASAVAVSGASATFAACTFVGGDSANGAGGAALSNTGPNPLALRGAVLQPGAPGGAASQGLADLNAPLVTLQVNPAWTVGATSTLTVTGTTSAPFAVFYAPDTAPTSGAPLVPEPIWATTGFNIRSGLLDATGSGASALAIPNVTALTGHTLLLQAFSLATSTVNGSTPIGGLIR